MQLTDHIRINQICIIGIILGVIAISGCVNQQQTPSVNNDSLECKISFPFVSTTGLRGISASISVSGFQGDENQVSWSSDDTEIAELNATTGSNIMIEFKNFGTTTIHATDNAVGPDCKASIEITNSEGPLSSVI